VRIRYLFAAIALCTGSAHGEPAVWQISQGDASTVWLLGSVHYLRDTDYPLPTIIDEIYTRADDLVMEIDLDDLDPVDVQTRFMQAAMLPATQSLSTVLDADVYADASRAAQTLGLELAALEPFEPWLAALTIMDLGMARNGFRADQGLEQHLLARARHDGKVVQGLETLADQISVFDGLSYSEQQSLLDQTLEEIDSPEREMDQLLDAWRSGRLDTLAGKLSESFADFPGLYEALVVHRNERWISRIESLAAQPGNTLVIVGALHLVGENNVVEMLRARSLEVVQISP